MLFLPKGPIDGDIVDPDKLARDYVDADRVASHTSQWQWASKAVNNVQLLEKGSHVEVRSAKVTASIGVTDSDDPTLNGADQFNVPYNTTFADITDVVVTWDSVYSELVMLVFSFQYMRRFIVTSGAGTDDILMDEDHDKIRFSVRLKVDGILQEGAGIYMSPITSSVRGTGFGGRALSSCVTVLTMLPAGTHEVVPVVCLRDATVVNDLDDEPQRGSADAGPTEGVVVANRQMIAVRFGRGQWLGA